jgi:hypothetical protein
MRWPAADIPLQMGERNVCITCRPISDHLRN